MPKYIFALSMAETRSASDNSDGRGTMMLVPASFTHSSIRLVLSPVSLNPALWNQA